MVEYVEENILSFFFSREEMHIVNDEHINHLVKIYKIICVIILNGVNELICETLRRNIQNSFTRKFFLNLNSNCMSKVSFTQTNATINKKWVERSFARFVGNCKSSGAS